MTKARCAKGEAKKALDQLDREVDLAFQEMRFGAIIIVVSLIGLVATIVYAVARHVFG